MLIDVMSHPRCRTMQSPFSNVVLAALLLCFAILAQAQSEREYYRKGLKLLDAGKYSEAVSALSTAIKLDDSNADAYAERGRAYCELKEYDKAIADLNQALRLDPDNAEAYENRGNSWDEKGDHNKAIIDFNQALRLDPRNAEFYYNRGIAWMRKGDYGRAIADYDQTVRLDPMSRTPATISLGWKQLALTKNTGTKGPSRTQTRLTSWTKGKDWNCVDTLAAAYAESGGFRESQGMAGEGH